MFLVCLPPWQWLKMEMVQVSRRTKEAIKEMVRKADKCNRAGQMHLIQTRLPTKCFSDLIKTKTAN